MVFSDQTLIIDRAASLALAVVGFIDDYVKVRQAQPRHLLEDARAGSCSPSAALIALALALGTGINTTLSFTRCDYPGWQLPTWLWVIWATLIIFATAHAVNVTDGLDGLAAGSALFGFVAFTVIAFWGFRNPTSTRSSTRSTWPCWPWRWPAPAPGSCGGTRRRRASSWATSARSASAPPSACWRVTTNTQLLLPIIGGLQVMEIGSVALQMGTYRLLRPQRRLFKMSPIHHHFELRRLAGDHGDHPLLGDLGHLRGRSPSASTTPTG